MEPLSLSDLSIVSRASWGKRTITYSFYVNSDAQHWAQNDVTATFGPGVLLTDMSPITTEQWLGLQQAIELWSAVADISLEKGCLMRRRRICGRIRLRQWSLRSFMPLPPAAANSRLKDYYDLWLIAETFELDRAPLALAVSTMNPAWHTLCAA